MGCAYRSLCSPVVIELWPRIPSTVVFNEPGLLAAFSCGGIAFAFENLHGQTAYVHELRAWNAVKDEKKVVGIAAEGRRGDGTNAVPHVRRQPSNPIVHNLPLNFDAEVVRGLGHLLDELRSNSAKSIIITRSNT